MIVLEDRKCIAGRKSGRLAKIGVILVTWLAFWILFFCCLARAHDQFGNPNWIANGHHTSPIDGSHCCGIADCTLVDSDDVHEARGGYSMRGMVTYGAGKGARNHWLDELVPYREIQPSRDGQWWRCKKPDGSRRCVFGPPPAT